MKSESFHNRGHIICFKPKLIETTSGRTRDNKQCRAGRQPPLIPLAVQIVQHQPQFSHNIHCYSKHDYGVPNYHLIMETIFSNFMSALTRSRMSCRCLERMSELETSEIMIYFSTKPSLVLQERRKGGREERKCDMLNAGGGAGTPCDFHCCSEISRLGNYRCFKMSPCFAATFVGI